MSPVEHNADVELLPDLAQTDLLSAVRAFTEATLAGRVSQSETVHAWAAYLADVLDSQPASASPRRWN